MRIPRFYRIFDSLSFFFTSVVVVAAVVVAAFVGSSSSLKNPCGSLLLVWMMDSTLPAGGGGLLEAGDTPDERALDPGGVTSSGVSGGVAIAVELSRSSSVFSACWARDRNPSQRLQYANKCAAAICRRR